MAQAPCIGLYMPCTTVFYLLGTDCAMYFDHRLNLSQMQEYDSYTILGLDLRHFETEKSEPKRYSPKMMVVDLMVIFIPWHNP